MTYDSFCARVRDLARRAGFGPVFSHEDGRHIARFPGGVTVTGNTVSPRVFVKWGSGHTALASI